MKELICPNCHKAFTVDEAGYASIVNQVKNAEFDAEINRRLVELHERHKAEEALVAAKAEQQYQQERSRQAQKLSEKEAEIVRLQTELGHAEEKKRVKFRWLWLRKTKRLQPCKPRSTRMTVG